MGDDIRYRSEIPNIAKGDVETLLVKDKEYGASWKRRGGVGAFMMAARKWDRLEEQVKAHHFDIFAAAAGDARAEGILDDVRDLRAYLLLIEAEVLVRAHDRDVTKAKL
jgi:hypothetical protein